MGDILVNSSELDAVRQALGVSSSVVSDTLINGLNFLPFVEGEVKELVPTWSTILTAGGQNARRLKIGVASWVASRLCQWLKRNESLSYKINDEYSQSGTQMNWSERAYQLQQESARQLAAATGSQVGSTTRPKLLTVSGPTRSGSNSPSTFGEWIEKVRPPIINWLEDAENVA